MSATEQTPPTADTRARQASGDKHSRVFPATVPHPMPSPDKPAGPPCLLLLEKFIVGMIGLPSLIVRKSLYTHRSGELRLGYFPVLHPNRVLDSLHRSNHLHLFSVRSQHCIFSHLTVIFCFLECLDECCPKWGLSVLVICTQSCPPLHLTYTNRNQIVLRIPCSLQSKAGGVAFSRPQAYTKSLIVSD